MCDIKTCLGTVSEFLNLNGVLAVLNAADIGESLGGLVKIAAVVSKHLKQNRKEKREHLFIIICYNAAFKTLKNLIQKLNLLDSLTWQINRDTYTDADDLKCIERYFGVPLCDRAAAMHQFYKELLEILKNHLPAQMQNNEHILAIFNSDDTVEEIYKCFVQDFLEQCQRYKIFREWIEEDREISLSKQLNNQYLPNQEAITSPVLLKHREEEEYWEQYIFFEANGHEMNARANLKKIYSPQTTEEQTIHLNWFKNLYDILSQAPLFINGPGGVGKSTFLTYLYRSISNGFINCPFSRVVLLSLDSLIWQCENCNYESTAPADNLILSYIAALSGNKNSQPAWDKAMKEGIGVDKTHPILILLDGFNEMYASKQHKPTVFAKIIEEISLFSNTEKYPNLRLVITSRVENENVKKELLNELHGDSIGVSFQIATLKGIKKELPFVGALNEEMNELFHRPMYYKHFKDFDTTASLPQTKYDALSIMFTAVKTQSVEQTNYPDIKILRKCVFNNLLPVIAKHMLTHTHHSIKNFEPCYEEFRQAYCLKEILSEYDLGNNIIAKTRVEKVILYAYNFLRHQEQIFGSVTVNNTPEFIFEHQDYRDFLAAEYLSRRIRFLKDNLCDDCWRDATIDMTLENYGGAALKLVYESLLKNDSYEDFFGSQDSPVHAGDITTGSIRWNYIAAQFSDQSRLILNSAISQDTTCQILNPVTNYVVKEYLEKTETQVCPNLNEIEKEWLVTVLMKTCEMHRRNSKHDDALQIAEAAEWLYNGDAFFLNKGVHTIISHNIAKVNLYKFINTDESTGLLRSLKMIYDCAEGTNEIPPYRFSCSLLAMILVSPQPKLAEAPDYKMFKAIKLGNEVHPFEKAFWATYRSIFCFGTQREDWHVLLYALRQLLFLLAENKVQIEVVPEIDLNNIAIEKIYTYHSDEQITIKANPIGSYITTKNNAILIGRFLSRISEYTSEWWYPYMRGLVYIAAENDTENAKAWFKLCKDTRSQLWLAYLNNDRAQLTETYKSGKKSAEAPTQIDQYNKKAYYKRDFGKLCSELYRRLNNE